MAIRCRLTLILALVVVHTTARDVPTLSDQKNFVSFGGVGAFSGIGNNGLPFGGIGGGVGAGGVTGIPGIGGAVGLPGAGGFGGLGTLGGLGGGAGAGGGAGGGNGVLPFP